MYMNFKENIKRGCTWIVGWLSEPRTACMAVTTFLSLMWFVVDWSTDTTFRAMSDWMLYLCNLLAMCLLLTPWMLSRRIWAQAIVILLVDAVFMANLMYNRTYLTAIPADSYAMVSNLTDFTASVTDSLRLKDCIFAIILIVGVTIGYRMPKQRIKHDLRQWLASIAILISVFGIGIGCRGGFYNAYDKLVQSCYHYTCGVPTYTVAGHIVYNVMDNHRQAILSDDARAEVDAWFKFHNRLPAFNDSIAQRQSVVLIICESLESWPIEKSVGGKIITPYLNSLVADSNTFYAPKMLTQVAAGHSIDAQLLMTAGLFPTTSGVYSMKYPNHTYPTLNKALKADRNAKSILMTSDKLITWNLGTIARSFGYDTLLHRDNWQMDKTIDRHLVDGSFFRQAVAELQKGKLWPESTQTMLTLLTYTGHNPFVLPNDMRDAEFDSATAGLPQKLRDYLAVTHYVDSQLHILIDYLRSRPDYDKTLIVLVGDHEALGTLRGELRQASGKLVSDGKYTPFIVLNSPKSGRYENIMGQIDVLPTVLDMMSVRGQWRGMGQSVLAPQKAAIATTTVPVQLYGDKTGVSPTLLRHLSDAPRISQRVIIHNLLFAH